MKTFMNQTHGFHFVIQNMRVILKINSTQCFTHGMTMAERIYTQKRCHGFYMFLFLKAFTINEII